MQGQVFTKQRYEKKHNSLACTWQRSKTPYDGVPNDLTNDFCVETTPYSLQILGHDTALQQIRDSFASGRMHHAWLITGVEGIGKATLAYHMAHHALSNGQSPVGNINPEQSASRLVMAESHPDFLIVRRSVDEKTGEQKQGILVDDALKIAAFLRKTATHGGWRVVVVDEAHRLNRTSMNSILKILEEPPPRTLIIMTTTTTGALLPTIKSRCRVLSLKPLDTKVLRTILVRQHPECDDAVLKQALLLSEGSVGFAKRLIESDAVPMYEEMLAILDEQPKMDIARLHRLSDQISRKADSENFEILTTLLINLLRHNIMERAQLAPALQADLEPYLTLWDKTMATLKMGDTGNLDRKLTFINTMTELRAAL